MKIGHRTRIFCIGFNKTGTTSLHRFFKAQGLKSAHNDRWPHATHRKLGRLELLRSHAYSDGECAQFETLVDWFPEAAFVLNVRDERSWLRSRVKHVFRHKLNPDRPVQIGLMGREFNEAPELAIDAWIARRRLYHARVRSYFAGDPRFLEINITDQQDWAERLSCHLQACGIGMTAAPAPSHANKRDVAKFADFPAIESYLALVDARLASFEPEAACGLKGDA